MNDSAPRYPLGEQNFEKIRLRGDIYVDKTHFIAKLTDDLNFCFLSRPRRFGKSLFISTLDAFFRGKRDLFEGLQIQSYPWDWKEYPVIHIDLSNGSYSKDFGLEERLNEILDIKEKDYGVKVTGRTPRARFNRLILELREKFSSEVVILIDEYEKPLLDAMGKDYFETFRSELHDFYSVLKDNQDSIRFLFITGVTRFGHLNIFSGLNNLTDISLQPEFSSICGITHDELLHNFKSGIIKFSDENGLNYDEAVAELKRYYDGYHFSRDMTDIYNPYSLLNCLRFSNLNNDWMLSGSSYFLIEQLKESRFDLMSLDGIKTTATTLAGIDASMSDTVTLLYQSGYLTIKDYDSRRQVYTLGLPNYEVSTALYDAVIPFYLGKKHRLDRNKIYDFIDDLYAGRAESAMRWLQSFFSSIPYDVKLDYESEFQEVVYCFFALVGLLSNTTLEKQTSNGRIDMLLETPGYIYIFEFKRGDNAKGAIAQIHDRKYESPWQSDGRKIIKIGVSFSKF